LNIRSHQNYHPKKKNFNRTPTQPKTLKELKNSNEYIILPSNKNLGPAINELPKLRKKSTI
jgi:hypothetical protein